MSKSSSCCLKDDEPVSDNRKLCFVNKLTIYTKDDTTLTLTLKTVKSTCRHFGVVWPWRRFYKWYFKRNSPAFMLKSDNEQTMIRRDSILSFRASISEEYEDISKW